MKYMLTALLLLTTACSSEFNPEASDFATETNAMFFDLHGHVSNNENIESVIATEQFGQSYYDLISPSNSGVVMGRLVVPSRDGIASLDDGSHSFIGTDNVFYVACSGKEVNQWSKDSASEILILDKATNNRGEISVSFNAHFDIEQGDIIGHMNLGENDE